MNGGIQTPLQAGASAANSGAAALGSLYPGMNMSSSGQDGTTDYWPSGKVPGLGNGVSEQGSGSSDHKLNPRSLDPLSAHSQGWGTHHSSWNQHQA